ncbi:MAG TPA: phage portal protein [Arthrobacter sp.]
MTLAIPEPVIDTPSHEELEKMFDKASKAGAGRKARDDAYEGKIDPAKQGVNVDLSCGIFDTPFPFCKIYVDAIDERLDVEGFWIAGAAAARAAIWEMWQRNGMDQNSHFAIKEMLVHKRSYIIIGKDENGDALITVHSAAGIFAEHDPLTRKIKRLFQVWKMPEAEGDAARATLYTANYNQDYTRKGGQWLLDERLDHNYGVCPAVALINRAMIGDYRGRSQMDHVVKHQDAAARILTNMQVSGETIAQPQRLIFGVSNGEITQNGTMSRIKAYKSAIMGIANQDGKAFQFPGADLRNYETSLLQIMRPVSAVTALSMGDLGHSTENPVSPEAQEKLDRKFKKKIRGIARMVGESFEEVVRIGSIVQGIVLPQGSRLETRWEDMGTPSMSQLADIVSKLRTPGADGRPLVSDRKAREMIGFSEEENRMEAERLQNPQLAALGLD